jgi:hypothetical protein
VTSGYRSNPIIDEAGLRGLVGQSDTPTLSIAGSYWPSTKLETSSFTVTGVSAISFRTTLC